MNKYDKLEKIFKRQSEIISELESTSNFFSFFWIIVTIIKGCH